MTASFVSIQYTEFRATEAKGEGQKRKSIRQWGEKRVNVIYWMYIVISEARKRNRWGGRRRKVENTEEVYLKWGAENR